MSSSSNSSNNVLKLLSVRKKEILLIDCLVVRKVKWKFFIVFDIFVVEKY